MTPNRIFTSSPSMPRSIPAMIDQKIGTVSRIMDSEPMIIPSTR